jgi:oligopeptide/dipeptide ABC transporter ATP-binding protein
MTRVACELSRNYGRPRAADVWRAGTRRATKQNVNLTITKRTMATTNNYLLKVEDLRTYFPIKKGLLQRTIGHIKAVDGVSFSVPAGKTLGLVGESGCGKTTTARTIARLIHATGGSVIFDGIDLLTTSGEQLKQLRKQISIIFQDPYSSLNPRMTVGHIVGESLRYHGIARGSELTDRVTGLLKRVGLSPSHINRYPHEFSGGQRQRIGIARALALNPRLVICDEPVSALDVSIQSQILNLLKDLQDEFGLTYLFIAHDLSVVEYVSDVVAVMYLGKIVELAPAKELYHNPLHPYTEALISAIPQVEPAARKKRSVPGGEIPSLYKPPGGCPFHPRCLLAMSSCKKNEPLLAEFTDSKGHYVACWKCIN